MRLFRSPALFFGVIVIVLIVGGGYFLFKDTTPPEIALSPATNRVVPGQKFTVTASDADSGIRSVTVIIRKNSQMQVLAKNTYEDRAGKQVAEFALKDTFLRDGAFTLLVNATDASFAGFGQGNSITREFNMIMDTTPPKIEVKTAYPYVRRGGSGCVSYKVNREVAATAVKVGDLYFPGFLQENGDWICFFAFPYFMTGQEYQPELIVTDLAGNKSATRLPVYRVNQIFRKDTIRINDRFLESKMPEFAAMAPGTTSFLELFNKVNGEIRQGNARKLMEIGRESAPKALWDNAFMALPGGAVRAGFAEHRTYLYNDVKQEIEATHLGLDLASTARSPVPAGNNGTVVFADYLGIYGNLVVIDHGLGLQSLYSHLSEISVSVGQNVARGEIIGRTGASGMAVGDHLHFGILISGLEVSPIEWLDRKWIRDNITDRLKEAGTPGPQLLEAAVERPAPTPAAPQPKQPSKPVRPNTAKGKQRR